MKIIRLIWVIFLNCHPSVFWDRHYYWLFACRYIYLGLYDSEVEAARFYQLSFVPIYKNKRELCTTSMNYAVLFMDIGRMTRLLYNVTERKLSLTSIQAYMEKSWYLSQMLEVLTGGYPHLCNVYWPIDIIVNSWIPLSNLWNCVAGGHYTLDLNLGIGNPSFADNDVSYPLLHEQNCRLSDMREKASKLDQLSCILFRPMIVSVQKLNMVPNLCFRIRTGFNQQQDQRHMMVIHSLHSSLLLGVVLIPYSFLSIR